MQIECRNILDRSSSGSKDRNKKKHKLLACVDLCSSDCEITYFNNRMVKRKDRRKSNGKELDMTADMKNNDRSVENNVIIDSQIKQEGNNSNESCDSNDLFKQFCTKSVIPDNKYNESNLEPEENITKSSSWSIDDSHIFSDLSSSMSGNEKSKGIRKRKKNLSEDSKTVTGKHKIFDELDSSTEETYRTKKKRRNLSEDSKTVTGKHKIFDELDSSTEETYRTKKKRRKNRIRGNESGVREFDIQDFHILLPFEVHPLHTYFSWASKPKIEELEQVREAGIEIKSGLFTAAEDQMIKNNWARFCKEHDIVIDPFFFFRFPKAMKSEERIKFLQYIGHGLSNRLLHLIHKRFVKVFKNPWQKKGKFTPEEDKMILKYIATSSSKTPIKDLTEMLNRDNPSIERRYRCLMQSRKTIKWDIHLVDEFVNNMLKICKLEDVKALESFTFKTKHWYKLSEKLKIPTTKLQKAWQTNIYPRLFAPEDIDIVDMKISIIERLYDSKENDWRNINWKEIAENYPGFTPLKTYMLFRQSVQSHVPKEIQKNLRETVRMMKSKVYKNRKFGRYKYCDGHVQHAN